MLPVENPGRGEFLTNDTRSARALYSFAKRIYSGGVRITLQEKITTVYRPLYAPFGAIMDWIPLHSSLLDIGCGSGTFLLLARGVRDLSESYGFDTNLRSLEIAEGANTYSNVHFTSDENNLDALISRSQVITCIDLLHHIPAQERIDFLTRLLDHTQKGQTIIIKDLDPLPRWKGLANSITDYLSTRSRVSYLSMDELGGWLSGRSVKIKTAERLDKYIWSHYQIVGERS